jgi:hypothetical protein
MTLDRRKNKRAIRAAKLRSETSRKKMSDTSTNNEHIERASESGRKVADEATRAGADVARRGAETARQALESGLNSTVHTFQRVTDQFTQVLGVAGPQAEELARKASQNMRSFRRPALS